MLAWEEVAKAAETLAANRWVLLGECAVVSRQVHGHGAPGDPAAGVYLGSDAGRNLYGLPARGQIVHADVMHEPGTCDPERLRLRLRDAARAFLRLRGQPEDETHRLLRWVEARSDTEGELGGAAGPMAAPTRPPALNGHVHLAFRAGEVPLEFVPLAVQAAEEAILGSGLALLRLESLEPTWQSPQRPPCACGTGGGAPAAGDAAGLRTHTSAAVPDLIGAATATLEGLASSLGEAALRAVADGVPDPVAALALRRGGFLAPAGPGAAALTAEGRVLRALVLRRRTLGPPPGGGAAPRTPVLPLRAARPPRRGTDPGERGMGLPAPVESVAAAVRRAGSPVRVTAADLRWVRRAARRPPDAVVALDRSPSMRSRLRASGPLLRALLRSGHAVSLCALPTGGPTSDAGEAPRLELPPPTRHPRRLAAALARWAGRTADGGTDLASGLRALTRALRARGRWRRTLCCVLTDGLATEAGAPGGDPFTDTLAAMREMRALRRVRVVVCGWEACRPRLRALAAAAGAGLWLVDAEDRRDAGAPAALPGAP